MRKIYKRTRMCGEFTAADIGSEAVVNGWVAKQRNLGGLVFCDIRDRTGIVQAVFDSDVPAELFARADALRSEYCVGIRGTVRERESKNPELPTGDIEIQVSDMVVYSTSDTPPIYVRDDDNVDDNLRLKYRYLDLRKLEMQENLRFRHRIAKVTRDYFDEQQFTEVETPMLIKPTPEGARDYLVPSRIAPGRFYALPQSPQMYKQLLMVGGTDRYMQIVKCFRDEDLRADRQPEFTQVDIEMSFVEEEDIFAMQEGYLKRLMKEVKGIDIETPFPRLSWDEAMERYGSDKPDTRFGFELKKLNDLFEGCSFRVFSDCLASGGDIRGICIDGGAGLYSRKKIDKLAEQIRSYGAGGLIWIKPGEDGFSSSINKFFSDEELQRVADRFGAGSGDLILIVADKRQVTWDALGYLRRHIASEMGLLDQEQFNFLWVVDFPVFEWSDEEGRYLAMHHPFTAPKEEDLDLIESDPGRARARAYDVVLNGVELGGGSIRIHDREVQQRMFRALGLSEEEIEEKFGFLVEAFRYGAPPHGGLAYGLDRMVMLLAGKNSIREVIAFPKNQAAQCMVSGAPAPADEQSLAELGLKLR